MTAPMMKEPVPNLSKRSFQLIWTWRHANCEPAGLRATPDSTEVTSWGRILSRSRVASKYLHVQEHVVYLLTQLKSRYDHSPLENVWISGVCKRSHPEALLTRYLQRNDYVLLKCKYCLSWIPLINFGIYRIVLAWLLEYFSHANFQSSLSPNLTPAEYAIQRRFGATGVSSSLYPL